jgi:general secretion pathway protein H
VKTPTFETSPDGRLQDPCRFGQASQRGFTLVELLVVFAIVGLIVAVVPLAFGKMRDSAQYTTTLRTTMGDLRQARQKAVATGVAVEFFVDLAQRRYGISGLTSHDLPEPLTLKVTFAEALAQPARPAKIVFLPEGGASGGSVEVIRPSGVGTRLRVDWLSGMVTQERLLE